jgi:hypothetical protein
MFSTKIKLLLSIALLVVTLFWLQAYSFWWVGSISSFFIGFFLIKRNYTALILTSSTSAICWITKAYYQDYDAQVSIAGLLSDIFGGIGVLPVYLITGLIISSICGLSAMAGNYFSRFIVDIVIK